MATAGVKGYVVPDGITTLSVPAGGPNAFGEVEVVGLEIKRIGFYLFLFSIHWVSSYHLVISHIEKNIKSYLDDELLEVAEEAETDVEAGFVFDEFFVVVGNARVVGMASCNKHLTSSAEQRSSGV